MTAKKIIATFVSLWILWVIFTGAIDELVTLNFTVNAVQEFVVGAIVSALIAGVSYGLFTRNPGDMINPKRWAYYIAYIPAYIWLEIKSHLNVAYLILSPSMPIEPSIVELPSNLRSDVGLTTLADSITMTPGTLTVDIDEEKPELFVHWISAGDRTGPDEVYKEVGKPLERFLKGGFD